jgi:hypothetical protein
VTIHDAAVEKSHDEVSVFRPSITRATIEYAFDHLLAIECNDFDVSNLIDLILCDAPRWRLPRTEDLQEVVACPQT